TRQTDVNLPITTGCRLRIVAHCAATTCSGPCSCAGALGRVRVGDFVPGPSRSQRKSQGDGLPALLHPGLTCPSSTRGIVVRHDCAGKSGRTESSIRSWYSISPPVSATSLVIICPLRAPHLPESPRSMVGTFSSHLCCM